MDSHLYSGYEVPSHYDPLLAKVIAWGRTGRRSVAYETGPGRVYDRRCGDRPFLRLLDEPAYVRQQLSTTFVESWLAEQGARLGGAHGASTPLQQGIGSGQGDGW